MEWTIVRVYPVLQYCFSQVVNPGITHHAMRELIGELIEASTQSIFRLIFSLCMINRNNRNAMTHDLEFQLQRFRTFTAVADVLRRKELDKGIPELVWHLK
jgi:hypothetical protein